MLVITFFYFKLLSLIANVVLKVKQKEYGSSAVSIKIKASNFNSTFLTITK